MRFRLFGLNISTGKDSARNFNAARTTKTTSKWQSVRTHINKILRYQLPELVGKSREQAQNNPYLKGYLGMVEENVAGPEGLIFQSKVKKTDGSYNEKVNDEIETVYYNWAERDTCTIHKEMSLLELEWLLVKLAKRDGEFLVKMLTGADVNEYGFAFEVFEWEDLDITMNEVLPNGNIVVMGKEYNEKKQVVNYYIKEYPFAITQKTMYKRVPHSAENIIHYFDKNHPRQARGIPETAASLISMYKIDDFEDSSLDNARVSAKKMGFIQPDATKMLKNAAGGTIKYGGGEEVESAEDEVFEMESSVYVKLEEGETFTAFDPKFPSDQHESFVKSLGRKVATGLRTSFNKLFKNLDGVNYSSLRSDEITDQRHWIVEQNKFIEGFHKRWFPVWFKMAVLSGKITKVPLVSYKNYMVPQWQGTRWQWVDPQKEVGATVIAINNNLTTLTDELANKGKDFMDVITRRKQELKYLIEVAKLQNELKSLTEVKEEDTTKEIIEEDKEE